ncbi:abhydrolase domain containing 4 [Planoprotostelium fungivorum]|uniref:Abhydrolase domain containing 4 n=1 Tax=Planoprotostelium fungivorum TaxID=1890364 RepID=A0A2P6NF19_9EUKA|nr:abhydrolase domain containing 4 [Planoprotostelium fungivorum]
MRNTVKTSSRNIDEVADEKLRDPSVKKVVIESETPAAQSWWQWATDWRWKPTSLKELEDTEREILKGSNAKFEQSLIKIEDPKTMEPLFINTVKAGSGPPLILLHGFAAGVGFWVGNLETFSKTNTVYAVDLMGFGRSTRRPFEGNSPEEAEEYFVESIEAWRKSAEIPAKFNLLGHSFGGYLAGAYSLKYPQNISHLYLVDPWGIPACPPDVEQNYSLKRRVIFKLLTSVDPLTIVRAAGPYGPGLVHRFRGDLVRKFSHLHDNDVVSRYAYHLNAQSPQGERAFSVLSNRLAWAAHPMISRLDVLAGKFGTTMIYGESTWMDIDAGEEVAKKLGGKLYRVKGAGHHCYIDNHEEFNNIMRHELSKNNKNSTTLGS